MTKKKVPKLTASITTLHIFLEESSISSKLWRALTEFCELGSIVTFRTTKLPYIYIVLHLFIKRHFVYPMCESAGELNRVTMRLILEGKKEVVTLPSNSKTGWHLKIRTLAQPWMQWRWYLWHLCTSEDTAVPSVHSVPNCVHIRK